jgi:hypothetical protein
MVYSIIQTNSELTDYAKKTLFKGTVSYLNDDASTHMKVESDLNLESERDGRRL